MMRTALLFSHNAMPYDTLTRLLCAVGHAPAQSKNEADRS